MPSKGTIILRCPICNWSLEAEKGDKLHPACTTQKPKQTDITEDVIERVYDCRNPECLNPIAVYYFMPKRRFERV